MANLLSQRIRLNGQSILSNGYDTHKHAVLNTTYKNNICVYEAKSSYLALLHVSYVLVST